MLPLGSAAQRFVIRHLSWPPFGRRPPMDDGESTPLGRRLLWFVGLWVAGVACLGLVSLAIKAMIGS